MKVCLGPASCPGPHLGSLGTCGRTHGGACLEGESQVLGFSINLCTSPNLSPSVKWGWVYEQRQGTDCPSKSPLLDQTQTPPSSNYYTSPN